MLLAIVLQFEQIFCCFVNNCVKRIAAAVCSSDFIDNFSLSLTNDFSSSFNEYRIAVGGNVGIGTR
ncbi:hypothetical protein DERP_004076 [Dermatophagoides pteronyssinus]|uniref:Secreted protein n=1 Tax=Dermatophagoides pteronyssinus TaxID=6956 RepID=A0ABQ8J8P6_DERPT|nr:hypothetical protein DERP_004076 [Dermatophagoides pteronyssinus]